MGQKVNPLSFRVGYSVKWKSCWMADEDFGNRLYEDYEIRKYLSNTCGAGIAEITIERSSGSERGDNELVTIRISTCFSGIMIGKNGEKIKTLTNTLRKRFKHNFQIDVVDVKRRDIVAKLVAEWIASQIENRFSYRSAAKKAMVNVMKNNVNGVKIQISGRLGGVEIARSEQFRMGRVSAHTMRSDLDFYCGKAKTVYGVIGVKVWIYRKDILHRLPTLSGTTSLLADGKQEKRR